MLEFYKQESPCRGGDLEGGELTEVVFACLRIWGLEELAEFGPLLCIGRLRGTRDLGDEAVGFGTEIVEERDFKGASSIVDFEGLGMPNISNCHNESF
jgi:hypothetical protein